MGHLAKKGLEALDPLGDALGFETAIYRIGEAGPNTGEVDQYFCEDGRRVGVRDQAPVTK
jgi:hypothetical protein